MLKFVKVSNLQECIDALAERITQELKANKRVLWLIPGGSNIPLSVAVMNMLPKDYLNGLSITLTDERYGPVGHKDSNWQQLIDAGFAFGDVKTLPILAGLSVDQTIKQRSKEVEALFNSSNCIIGQFGIGTDGHIAGVLPQTIGTLSSDVLVSYDSESYLRISLTLAMIKKINVAYAFAFGESKKDALTRLQNDNLSIDIQPAQILKSVPESYVYSDQF